MRAILIESYGGPEVLRLGEVDPPPLGATDVRIRLHAAGVNHIDHDVREGIARLDPPLPHIPGVEGAGEIVEIGREVTEAAIGERVVPYNTFRRGGRHVLAGEENICPHRQQLGMHRWGTYADLVVVNEQELVRIPDGMDYVTAAASTICFGTAWNMAVERGRLIAGETVLVNAAGSGVGSSAIQIAKLHGARVIATAGSDAKLEKALEIGADHVLDYNRQDIVGEIARLTEGAGVDLVLESVGGKVLTDSIEVLRNGGRLVTCGAHAGEEVALDVVALFRKQITLLGNHYAPRRHIGTALELVARGAMRPVIQAVMPLEQVRDAAERARDRNLFGKLVLTH